MNYAFRNGKILDGTKEMKIQQASPLPDLYAPLSELYYVQ